jgi:membrane protein required for colicin V production
VRDLPTLDAICLALLLLAALRGLWLGIVREAFSIVALLAALVAVRLWTAPVARWLELEAGSLGVGPVAAPWLAGALLAAGTIVLVAVVGRVVRGGVRAAGLGLVDRLAGAGLGAAEGALAAGLLLFALVSAFGADHPALAGSRSLELFERAQRVAGMEGASPQARDVAAPPRRGR